MPERMAGVAEALAEFGMSLDDMPIMEACGTPEEEEAFGNGAAMALDMAPEATAVIALSDGVALSIIKQARKRGLSVPRDLSVVGFDDLPLTRYALPPLTTVHHPAYDLGQLASAAMLQLLRGEKPTIEVPAPHVVVRESSGPVAAARRT